MKQIPDATIHIWKQQNTGDVLGDLFASKGIDLVENLGKLRLGKRLVVNMNNNDAVLLDGYPVGFRAYNFVGYKIYTIAGSFVYVATGDFPSTPFAVDTTIGYPGGRTGSSLQSDIETYNGSLYVTLEHDLMKLNSGGWSTASSDTLGNDSAHQMCNYNGLLYIVDNFYQIYSFDGTTLNTSLFTLNGYSDNVITFIKAAADCIWIGTLNRDGTKALVYKWDGAANVPTSEYKLDSAGALACVIKDNVPHIMDVFGRLLEWNGGTFVEIGRINRRRNKMLYNALSENNNRYVHPNGMSLINGRINVLIDTRYYDATSGEDESDPAGIWEYDEQIGFYHKGSFGLSHATDAITDYGAFRIAGAGGLTEINIPDTSSSRNGTFLAGANYFSDATTVKNGVFYDDSNDTLQKGGYFVTQKIEATDGSVYGFPTVEGMWQSFYTVYRKLLASTDMMIPKYRYNDLPSVEAPITWLGFTSFTVPNSSVDISNYWTNSVGGEVEIMQGIGAGRCAHITNAVLSGGVWTVTLDDAFAGITAGVTSMARFQTWNKISMIEPNNQNFNSDTISEKSTWLQIKLFALFTGRDEIERILISNGNATPVK